MRARIVDALCLGPVVAADVDVKCRTTTQTARAVELLTTTATQHTPNLWRRPHGRA